MGRRPPVCGVLALALWGALARAPPPAAPRRLRLRRGLRGERRPDSPAVTNVSQGRTGAPVIAQAPPDTLTNTTTNTKTKIHHGLASTTGDTAAIMIMDDEMRNDHGHCGPDYREQVLCDIKLVKP